MYYSEDEARKLVIEAGYKLLETGLIARTWGNISARISKDEFIITPSGLAYDSLKPEQLVRVKASDLSYIGNLKPSSEKGIHAIAYILRPEVNFIIHTHQFYATAISLERRDTNLAAASEYGLPSTDKLKGKVMQSIAKHPDKKAFFMERHGAVILGTSCEETFEIAKELEEECKAIFKETVTADDYIFEASQEIGTLKAYIDDFAQILGSSVDLKKPVNEICSGVDAEAERMILEKNCACALYAKAKKLKPMNIIDANLQRTIYLTKYSKLKDKAK